MPDPHHYAHAIAAAIEQVGNRLPTPEEWCAILALTVRRRIGRDRRVYQKRWNQTRRKEIRASRA
jgi:hypothetical protein